MVQDASSVLVIGSSLATYSAYRLLKEANDQAKPISMISIGPSRGDPLVQDDLRFDLTSTEVLRATLALMRPVGGPDATFDKLASSGVIKEVDRIGKFPSAS
jgi:NAD-dependent deacetylase sirtuin 4